MRPYTSAVKEPSDLPVVEFEEVYRNFSGHVALSNLSFHVKKGEIMGIIGHSGAGKTTLLRCLAGLEKPDSGKVKIEGNDIASLPRNELLPLRQRIGLIFQHFNLISSKTIIDNIALPLKISGVYKRKRLARAQELLELVGLPDKAYAYPAQLSGGQKQRVGIARALAANPALLLCDEATSALDPETTRSIVDLLIKINKQFNLTIVLITHEMSVIRLLADRVIVLQKGKIIEEGPVTQIFAKPKSEVTKQLLSEEQPTLPATILNHIHQKAEPNDYAIIHVTMLGDVIREPLIANIQKEFSISVILLEGRISHIRETPIGTMFLAVSAHHHTQAMKAFIALGVETVESLGYVSL
ncbi:Methionine import ATP-binding protein MetN 2 [Commensalibacter sp. Nvir]|uniref:methionine ABC transporter ATP-binding protein n=1 Tax=Commensalibacter sp. Nvir TaxID=3069817 RepID=UPI002D5815F7|nr:Methionine import ATP-binding protein MetN 2 [Commensalibacter sp. Nvir]